MLTKIEIEKAKKNPFTLGSAPCAEELRFFPVSLQDGRIVDIQIVCGLPYCSNCEAMKNIRLAAQIAKHVEYHNGRSPLGWQLVTMSVTNDELVRSCFIREARAWKRFREQVSAAKRRNTTHPWRDVSTWVGWRELTYSDQKGFNLHRHKLVGIPKGSRFDWKEMHQKWDRAAEGGSHFNSKPIRGNMKLGYVSKYTTKDSLYWGGLSKLIAFRFAEGLLNKNRLIRARGSKPPMA